MILHPSLASADPLRYAEALTALHDAPLGSLHLDIEDTSFINNITFGMKTIQAVAQHTRHPLSFHLMVSSPQRWFTLACSYPPRLDFHSCRKRAKPLGDSGGYSRYRGESRTGA